MSQVINVKIVPRASSNKIEQTSEDSYKVWVTSPAQDGKANAHLIKLLAKHFSVAKSSIEILKGAASREKLLKIGMVLITLLGLAAPQRLYAKEPPKPMEASSQVDKEEITIGDDIKYALDISHNKDITVSYPEAGLGLGQFEIKDYSIEGPVEKGDRVYYSQSYVISAYTLGDFSISPIKVDYTAGDGSSAELTLKEIKITVKPVIRKESDVDDIRGIKPQAAFSRKLGKVLFLILLILLTAAAAAAAGYYYFFRKKNSGFEQAQDMRPPEEIAVEELNRLKESSLIKDGRIKDYCDRLSDIIRGYIHGRWDIDALEKTTWELYQDLRSNRINRDHVDILYSFLKECDLVKFAKYTPLSEALEKITGEAYRIVKDTTPHGASGNM